jgi:integrase
MNTITPHHTLTVQGRDFILTCDERTGYWRVRRRCSDFRIDRSIRVRELSEAKKVAKQLIELELERVKSLRECGHNLDELCNAYLEMPKPVREYIAERNVAALKRVVKAVLGRRLTKVFARTLTYKLWEDYAAIRHGGKLDLSTPRRENVSIMSEIRMAASIFSPKLEHRYAEQGIVMDWDNVRRLPCLPVLKVRKSAVAKESLEEMKAAWEALRTTDEPMYITIGLAWWCGLRASELMAAQRHWLVENNGHYRIELRDRPEENFRTKTNLSVENRFNGMCLHDKFGFFLLSLPDGKLVQRTCGAEHWLWKANAWVRQFIPKTLDTKGLHKLRGLFCDAVMHRFEQEILARRVGTEAAAMAVGHSSTRTTEQHYLTS